MTRLSQDKLLSLIDQIYSTVATPTHWPAVVAEIARLAGTPRGLLFTPYHGMGEGGMWFAHNLSTAELENYIDYYYQTDLWTLRAFARDLPTRYPINCETLVPPDELDRSEFYNDYLRHIDIRGAYSVMFGGEKDSYPRVHLSVYRPNKSEPFDAETGNLLNTLTPHLHRALDLGFRFAGLHSRARGKLEALNRLGFAVAGLDLDGSIAFMNRRAEEILTSNDGLAIRHQCIVAANNDDNEDFWQLIRNTIGALSKNARFPGGATTVRRPSGRRDYAVTVAPGAGAPSVAGIPTAWALIFIVDPTLRHELPAERIARRFGLTAAEAQLAAALAAGRTLSEYAEAAALSMHTVRGTLKHVFAKTDTRRQVELVRLLLTSAAADMDLSTENETGTTPI